MSPRRTSFSVLNPMLMGFVLLVCPLLCAAQHHGGGHGGLSGGIPGASGRPSGVDEKDTLKDFHQAMAMQATSQQVAGFQTLIKSIETAQVALQAIQRPRSMGNGVTNSADRDALDKAIQAARNGNKKFQEGFSAAQKSGLKEIVKRLAKSDSDLEQEGKRLDESAGPGPEAAAHAESLNKALTDLYNQELALGREMSITLANGQDLAFTLPQVKSPVNLANRTIAVSVAGALSQTAAQGGQRTFKLELVADLSDLQEDVTELMRAQLDTSETCGQRVTVRQATLVPAPPASLMVVTLHYERWTCMRSFGQQTATELAEGEGSAEIRLTTTIDKSALDKSALKITSAFGRIDASGMLGDALRSGSLGDDLRDKAAQLLLSAVQAGSNFKIALPPAIQNSATIQNAKFQDTGVGGLSLAVEGQIEISNEQADQLASQLNQSLSAQGTEAKGIPELRPRTPDSPPQ